MNLSYHPLQQLLSIKTGHCLNAHHLLLIHWGSFGCRTIHWSSIDHLVCSSYSLKPPIDPLLVTDQLDFLKHFLLPNSTNMFSILDQLSINFPIVDQTPSLSFIQALSLWIVYNGVLNLYLKEFNKLNDWNFKLNNYEWIKTDLTCIFFYLTNWLTDQQKL